MTPDDDRETLAEFIRRNNLTMTEEEIGRSEAPVWQQDAIRGARFYRCTILVPETDTEPGGEFTVNYMMGPALSREPSLKDVLDSVASDISTVENTGDRWEWMAEYGYLEDPSEASIRSAATAYEEIQEQRRHLVTMLGEQELHRLVWQTERL